MPLPTPSAKRVRMHQRSVKFEGFKRADGLWDIEARLVDTKDHDFPLSSGLIRPGQAVHDMSAVSYTHLDVYKRQVLWWYARPLVEAYTSDPAVRLVALSLIGYVAIYQVFDALQTVAAYSLRGYKITFVPVSYTHLDVYKRQSLSRPLPSSTVITPSLPTLSIACAIRSPMLASEFAEMVPTLSLIHI